MQFLCDEWLCDVATDYAGKCGLIAAALSIIKRSLLPERPCFFITAGRRGGGKTTTINMLIKGVTGIHPAASAWSTNEFWAMPVAAAVELPRTCHLRDKARDRAEQLTFLGS